MNDPCADYRQRVEQALKEWREIQAQMKQATGVGGEISGPAPQLFFRARAAQQQYRAAVRALSECLREHGSAAA